MRIDVSDPLLCGCDTCVQHRTLCISNTQETEPSNVIGSSVTSVPVSPGPVQPLGSSTSDQSSGTETTPLAPTTSVNPEPAAQSVDSTIFKFPPVSSEPAQALAPTASGSMQGPAFGFAAFAAHRPWSLLGASATTSEVNGSSPISFAPPVTTVSSTPVQSLGTTTTSATAASSPVDSSSPTTFQFHPAFTSIAASGSSVSAPMQAPTFGSGASTATFASSTSSPFDVPGSLQAPVQANGPNTSTPFSFLPTQDSGKTASVFPPPFGYPAGFARPDVGISPTAPSGYFGESHFSSPSGGTPKNPFGYYLHPGFGGVRYPSNLFGPNPQTLTPVSGRSPFWGGVGIEQGSRYPRYAPTPDLLDYSGGPCKLLMSISASNSQAHKSHEELRWEDYKNGDKGGFGWFPAAHTSPFSSPTVSPSLFASPSIPHRRPQMRTVVQPHGNMNGFSFGNTIPTAVQSHYEPVGVSSPASGCTACGATSSSSPSVHLGLNGTTNPPSAVASLPGLFLSTYGSCPLLFGTPNLAACGTTTPAIQAYAIIFGTNLISQGTTAIPAVQAYPVMFGTPNLAGGTATTSAVHACPMMFGTPNLAGQGATTTPAVNAYPMMFGTPNLSGQGTATTPAVHAYPTMFGTPNLAGQGTTTTPAAQPYPMMFGVTQATTTPAAQPYPMMFGTPSLGGQGITPAAQSYPAHGLTLPFAAMSLQ